MHVSNWFKWLRKPRLPMTVEVAAASLLLRCENRLVRSDFKNITESSFEKLGFLSHLSKVAFVMYWLDEAGRNHACGYRADEVLVAFRIAFNPYSFESERSAENEQISFYLAELGGDTMKLVDSTRYEVVDEATRDGDLDRWCRLWLTRFFEDEAEIEMLAEQCGVSIARSLADEIKHIRFLLADSMRTT